METTQSLTQTAAFWEAFYTRNGLVRAPSPFALWCLDEGYLSQTDHLLELGCGNGRDTFAFMEQGIQVLAVDACHAAIAHNATLLDNAQWGQFSQMDLCDIASLAKRESATPPVQAVYSRFVMHAIPESTEDIVLNFCTEYLPQGSLMLHEFRTTRDPLMQQGEVLSSTERLTDHYRRFIDAQAFRKKLHARGWQEKFFIESDGLAKFKDENPVVCRIVVEKGVR